MHSILKLTVAAAALALATQAMAQVTFYEHPDFRGGSFTTDRRVGNFERFGFSDRASSVVVQGDRWTRWEVCDQPRFDGRCVVLRPGRYRDLAAMGLDDRVTSVRMVTREQRVDDNRYSPAPVYDYRRRDNERLFEAPVTSVRAVLGTPEQRCWVEREQISEHRSGGNVPGAIAGAVIGGILGHQIGGGTGRDIATVGGVVAGAAIGNQVNRNNGGRQVQSQPVQRCANAPGPVQPDYWDVTYNFRGQDHRVQLAAPPGPTVTVNRLGEPRAQS